MSFQVRLNRSLLARSDLKHPPGAVHWLLTLNHISPATDEYETWLRRRQLLKPRRVSQPSTPLIVLAYLLISRLFFHNAFPTSEAAYGQDANTH